MTGTAGAIKEKAIKKTVMEYIELGQDIPTPEIGRLVEAMRTTEMPVAEPIVTQPIQETEIPTISQEKLHHTLLPFGEGQKRISMHAAKIKEKLGLIGNLKDLTLEERAELLTYNQMNREGKIALATEYVLQNEQRAWDVLYNRRIPPKDIPVVAIGIAMENLAVDNWKIASDLTSLRGTRYGQENSLFAEADPHSPVKYLNQIVQSRVEAMGGKSEVAAKRTHEMNSIQKEINKGISSKTAWDSFIRSIEC